MEKHISLLHVWRPTAVNQYLSFVNIPCLCAGRSWPGKFNLWPSYYNKSMVWCLRESTEPSGRTTYDGKWKKTQEGTKGQREEKGFDLKKLGPNTSTNLRQFFMTKHTSVNHVYQSTIWKSGWMEQVWSPQDRICQSHQLQSKSVSLKTKLSLRSVLRRKYYVKV